MRRGDGWYTPKLWTARARRALGGRIGIDPAGAVPELDSVHADEAIVQCKCPRAAGRVVRTICDDCGQPDGDGLAERWALRPGGRRHATGWINPPYSNLGPWAAKIVEEARELERVLALVPLRPSSRWWRVLASSADFIGVPASRISFIDGGTGKSSAATGRAELTFFGWRLAEAAALRVIELRVVRGLPGQAVLF